MSTRRSIADFSISVYVIIGGGTEVSGKEKRPTWAGCSCGRLKAIWSQATVSRSSAEKAIVLALGSVCAFGVGEAALRYRGTRHPEFSDSARIQYLEMYSPVFRRIRRDGAAYYEAARPRMQAKAFPALKAPESRRIFIIGSSTAQGFPEGALTRKLGQVLPGLRFEVINCGMVGFDAYRTLLVGQEILRYGPDLVVVIVGNSEFFGLRRLSRWSNSGWISWSRLLEALGDRWDPPVMVRGQAEADRYYAQALSKLIALAEERRVPLLLCTIPVNYRDNHFAGPDDPVTEYDMLWDRAYIRLLDALRRGEGRGAQAYLEALAGRYPANALWEYCAAAVAELRAQYGAARRHYERALAIDPHPVSCTAERNELIRALAAAHGLPLADVAGRFQALAPHGIAGFEVFKDNCHPQPAAYGIYADAIVEALFSYDRGHGAAALASAEAWTMNALTRTSYAEASRDAVHLTRWEAQNDIRALLTQGMAMIVMNDRIVSPTGLQCFQRLNERHPALLRDAVSQRDKWKALLRTTPWLMDSLARFDENWGRVLLHAAEALRRSGRYREALPLFDAAIAGGLDRPETRCWRGWTLLALGRKQAAERDFKAAVLPRDKPRLGRSGTQY
ncbi:MAG: hypothetical protein NTY77_08830 [Elusimicrobia bacterium]|nr:hypothetical protein [Elusimicrobiota bacterium]